MFEFSSDSLTDYVYSFPTTPIKSNPIVLERVEDPNYAFDSIVPTTPSHKQIQSIQKGELPSIPSRINYSTQKQTSSDPNTDPEPESSKLPFITNIYIASITVIGLFLLFRMIQK